MLGRISSPYHIKIKLEDTDCVDENETDNNQEINDFDDDENLSSRLKRLQERNKRRKKPSEAIKCDICEKTFKNNLAFGLHTISHNNNSKYSCHVCKYASASRYHFEMHMRVHEGSTKYKCKVCDKAFAVSTHADEHKYFHSGEKPFECEICGKHFSFSRFLSSHRRSQHWEIMTGKPLVKYDCQICNKHYTSSTGLKRHKISKHNDGSVETSLLCDVCGKRLASKEILKFHRRIHTGYKPHVCNICTKSFTRKEQLKEHERVHTGEKPFICKYCGKGFTQRSPLRIHERTHTGEKPYNCRLCNKGYISKGIMDTHMKNCQGLPYERVLRSKIIFLKEEIDYEYDIAIPKLEKPKPRTWLCRKCRCEFKTRRLLDQHRKEAHWREDNDSQYKYTFNKDEDCYTCITCDVEIKSKEEIEEHVRTHDESYSCTTCDATFHSAYKYSVHMHKHCDDDLYRCPLCVYNTRRITSMLQHINRTHLKKYLYYCSYCGKGFGDVVVFREHENNHLGAKPFICVVCNKTFAFSRYLLLHQTRYHTVSIMGMLNKNQCKVCKKIFSRKTTLEKHIKRHDAKRPKQKIHLCDNCGKGYATKNKLELHYRVHTGYKPYMCSYCEKCFTKKEYLVMHERIHSGEKPYTCPFCVKCFNQDAPLRLHIRGHTGERPYSCHICKEGFISKAALKLHFKNCNG